MTLKFTEKELLIWFIICLFLTTGLAYSLPQFEGSLESEHFTIFYHQGFEQQAEALRRAHEGCYCFVTDFIGYWPEMTEIYLCATPEEIYNYFGYPKVPSVDESCGQWHNGVLSYYNPVQLIDVEGALATHEFTHAVERRFTGFRFTFWWREGLACYLTHIAHNDSDKPSFGGLYPNQYNILSDSILRNDPPFRTLQDLVDPPADSLSYIISTTVFLYLDENYNQSVIKETIQAAKNDEDITKAFEATLDVDFNTFQAEWENYLFTSVEAIADSQDTIEEAERENRTIGLEEARRRLSDSLDAFNSGKLGMAVDLANEAIVLAESSTVPTPVFECTGLEIGPQEADVGDTISISITLRNTGTGEGEKTIILKINDMSIENKTVTLAPGASQVITFIVSEESEGVYNVNLAEQTGSFTVKSISDESISKYPTPLIVIAFVIALSIFISLRRVRRIEHPKNS